MFTPNLIGSIRRKQGYDLNGTSLLSDPRPCQFAIVNAKRQSEKTSVRADSSASRGAADNITTGLGSILVAKHEQIEIGDYFYFDGDAYEVKSKFIRRSVAGVIDHFECDIEVMPR